MLLDIEAGTKFVKTCCVQKYWDDLKCETIVGHIQYEVKGGENDQWVCQMRCDVIYNQLLKLCVSSYSEGNVKWVCAAYSKL